MGMSKKDFNAMAIEFGMQQREINFDSDQYSKAKRTNTLNESVYRFCSVARMSNPLFAEDRFTEYVADVAERRRDNTGKLVKGKVVVSVGNCHKCNSWDDTLENNVCQTCLAEEREEG